MSGGGAALRDAILIVIAGATLGLLYNAAGRASHPPRGLAWLATPTKLVSLDDVAAASSDPATADTPATAVPRPAPPIPPPAVHREAGPAPTPSHESAATAPGTAAPATPATPAAEPVAERTIATPPARMLPPPAPFVPESDQPVRVELPAVRRFFAAHGALFVDARDPAEYEAGHIPGAQRLTNNEAQNDPALLEPLRAAGRPIITYCEGGTCEASLDLARTLVEAGFRRVLVYEGGFPEWQAAGEPVERGSGAP